MKNLLLFLSDRIVPKTTDIKFKKTSDSTSIIVIADGDLIANETIKMEIYILLGMTNL